VAERAREAGAATRFAGSRSELVADVASAVRPGDLVLTLGAGDLTSFGPELLARMGA